METKDLKKYAPQARRDFIEAVTNKAAVYGLLPDETLPMQEEGDVVIIGERAFPRTVANQRKELETRIRKEGFQQFIEAVAYTWFNRFVAIRYMELHGYLDHGYRVLSHPEGKTNPEIMDHAERVELPGLDRDAVIDLKLDGGKDEELYQTLLIAQCNALHSAMPFLFESIRDGAELLLPDNLLHTDSLVRTLAGDIPEDQWENVEIIGWLYQFYISEKKDEVIGKVVKSEDIPAATQLFTPNWIVKYLVHNTLGHQWMATYPDSPLKQQMEFYIEPAEQTAEVQQQLDEITPESLNPEELTLLDPACGSGHILVEAYDLFKAIYTERGYRARDIPKLILTKNLFGLELDDRAAQLSALALMMKARADDHRIMTQKIKPSVHAIFSSAAIDHTEVSEALNDFVRRQELPPSEELFEEIEEQRTPLFARSNLAKKGNVDQEIVAELVDLFRNGRALGSLISIPSRISNCLPHLFRCTSEVIAHGGMFQRPVANAFLQIVNQACLLANRYSCVVTNPPYMGARYMNPVLREFAKTFFKENKSDLFAICSERFIQFVSPNGSMGLMTPFTWMFIKSYEALRTRFLTEHTLCSLVRPEYHAFFDSAFVPICAFVVRRKHAEGYRAEFIDLSDFYGEAEQPKKTLEAIKESGCSWRYSTATDSFLKIPGNPIAFWISSDAVDSFRRGIPLSDRAIPRAGMITGDNDRFIRLWHEVDFGKIGLGFTGRQEASDSGKKWFPYQKGGAFRKWYGNFEFVVDWENDGHLLRTTTNDKGKVPAHAFNEEYIFKPNVNWSAITSSHFSTRITDSGCLFDASGSAAFPAECDVNWIAGFLNSKVAAYLLKAINPTLNFQAWNIGNLPLSPELIQSHVAIDSLVDSCKLIARRDWDSFETSWDFCGLPFSREIPFLSTSIEAWHGRALAAIGEMAQFETNINTHLIDAYRLKSELQPAVSAEAVTLYCPDVNVDVHSLLSYSIGCMMGRYSLDEEGLCYALSGGNEFDPRKYETFPADEDGIVPITDIAWFSDDAATRFEEFVKVAWPEEHLEENLDFVAESLSKKKGESSRDCIRRYIATSFYKNHLSMYKKRPIYWLFSSGKQKAFQCLVYLHRYNAGTLSRMRTEYVVKLQGKINARIDQLENDIPAASSTSHRKKLEKEQGTLIKQRDELQTFDEKLRHYADLRIELDLDDGVKVNYGKFGDLLAEVKAITGKKPEVLS